MGNREIFEQLLRQSDPYAPYAGAVNSLNFRATKPGQESTAIGVGFAKAILAGLLQGKREKRVLEQTKLSNQLLAELGRGNVGASIEGLDPLISSGLKREYMDNKADRAAKRRDALELEFLKGELAEPGTRQAMLSQLGLGEESQVSALPPAVLSEPKAGSVADDITGIDELKAQGYRDAEAREIHRNQIKDSRDREDEIFDREETLANSFRKDSQEYQYRLKNFKGLLEAYKDQAGTSDYEIIRKGAQAVEPKLAVRRDDEQSLQGAADVLGLTRQYIDSVIFGDTKLSPKVRDGIMRIAARNLAPAGEEYDVMRSNVRGRAENYGVDPDSVAPFGSASIAPYAPGQEHVALAEQAGIDPTVFDPVLEREVAPPVSKDIPAGMKLIRNSKTGETKLVPQ